MTLDATFSGNLAAVFRNKSPTVWFLHFALKLLYRRWMNLFAILKQYLHQVKSKYVLLLDCISLTVCIYFNWIMQNNLLFTKLNWCHWGLLVTIGMRLTSITLHYTPSCVDSEHCVYATVWMWTITITSNETWQNKPGLGSKGEHSRHSPGIPRSEYWVSNKLWELLHFFWPLLWIVNKLFGEGKLENAVLRIFADNTRFSRRQLILMPIVSTQDFYMGRL